MALQRAVSVLQLVSIRTPGDTMPNINAHQISLIHYAHARGFSAHRIAALSGVTPAATERYLLKHRLNTNASKLRASGGPAKVSK